MFDFSNETQEKKVSYLNQAGLHTGVEFKELVYEATPTYECFDLVFDVNGQIFRDRTFGTSLEKVLTKTIVDKNTNEQRKETQEEAYQRTYKEIYFKLLYLGKCFVDEKTFREATGTFSNLKELIEKVNSVIPTENRPKLNILTGFKNSDSKQRSNLIIPERIQWVEPTKKNTDGSIAPATIRMTVWQQQNMMVEKYPYMGTNNESTQTESAIINADDLPF